MSVKKPYPDISTDTPSWYHNNLCQEISPEPSIKLSASNGKVYVIVRNGEFLNTINVKNNKYYYTWTPLLNGAIRFYTIDDNLTLLVDMLKAEVCEIEEVNPTE